MPFKIEYLFPFIAASPQWVKFAFYIWVVLSAILLFQLGSWQYKQNLEKAVVVQKNQYVEIDRILDDFKEFLSESEKIHEKKINEIALKHNARGALHSGGCVEQMYESVKRDKVKIITKWKEEDRKIQDHLISLGHSDIKDAILKQKYDNSIEIKENSLNKIYDFTEEWLKKRDWLVGQQTAENIRKHIFGK